MKTLNDIQSEHRASSVGRESKGKVTIVCNIVNNYFNTEMGIAKVP